jgi:hypothetical protein
MGDELQKRPGNPVPTEAIPNIYANVASVASAYHEVRIYFCEAHPKEIATQAIPGAPLTTTGEATVAPRVCLVLSPGFARNLRDSLNITLETYQEKHGPLRPNPTPPTQPK